jgi:ribosome biogenesis ATPase
LGNLHQAAAVAALKRDRGREAHDLKIEREDWEVALGKVRASVRDVGKYRRLKERGM